MTQTVSGAQPAGKQRAWFDPRFAIGIVLVLVSVLGVWWLVASADRTVAVYEAAETLTAGEIAGGAKLHVVNVRLAGAEGAYLAVGTIPDGGLIVNRTVGEGELVPVSAVGEAAGAGVTSVVVTVRGTLAASIHEGSVVDVWSAKPDDSGAYEPPSVLVGGATVVESTSEEGFLGDAAGTTVEVLVPRSKVAAVLAAISADHAIALVPADAGR